MKKKYYLFKTNIRTAGGFGIFLSILVFIIVDIAYGSMYCVNILMVFGERLELIIFLLLPYFLLHELLHCVGYVLYGADYKKITFGMRLEKGYFFCLCKQNITKKAALISLIYPFFFIGIVTLIIGLILNIPTLIMLSIINILGCGADLLTFYSFFKLNDFEFSESDDPLTFGLYTNEDLSKKKLFGITYVKTLDELERKDLKKFDISIESIVIAIAFYIFSIINMIINKS